MNSEIILNTKDLCVGYGKKTVVPDINFEVKKGEILVLIGPNGAGKSTLLKTLIRQLKEISGAIILEGTDINDQNESDIAKKMAVLMTERPKTERLTIEDIVSAGRYPYTGMLGVLEDKDRKAVENALGIVGLLELKNRDYNEISDGQKQLVMLARAIAQEPEIMILDEPTSFLDIKHKLEMLVVLKRMVMEKNMAVIMSLHEYELARCCADHILCVGGGRIDRYGTPEEIFGDGDYINSLYGIDEKLLKEAEKRGISWQG